MKKRNNLTWTSASSKADLDFFFFFSVDMATTEWMLQHKSEYKIKIHVYNIAYSIHLYSINTNTKMWKIVPQLHTEILRYSYRSEILKRTELWKIAHGLI